MLEGRNLEGGVGGVLRSLFQVAALVLLVGSPCGHLYAQCVVNSTTGYSVTTVISPLEVVRPSSCPWGYNYNLRIRYDISMSGENIPSGLPKR